MKKNDIVIEWMNRAKSNLLRAKLSDINEDIYYEDLCFDAQQCVEKSLNALCIFNSIPFPKTHDISYLIEILNNNHIKIPAKMKKAEDLTDYSVETRYPGDYDEVTEREYKKVIRIAEEVFDWVRKKIKLK
jgi:HEPN domain-containing protein